MKICEKKKQILHIKFIGRYYENKKQQQQMYKVAKRAIKRLPACLTCHRALTIDKIC